MAKEVQTLTKKQQRTLLKQLQSAKLEADVEKAVERAVINMLEAYFSNHEDYGEVTTTYDYKTDGIIQATSDSLFGDSLTILLEAKRNKNFTENKKDIISVVAQVVSYLHTIKKQDPHKYPQVVVIADNNEIFMIPAIALSGYADGDYDWSLAASEMHKDGALMSDLEEDKNIRPVISDIDANFSVVEFCNRIVALSQEAEYEKIKIGKSSLVEAFENFRKMVYGTNDPNVIQDENRQQIELFCRTLFGDEEVYAHPKKKNVLVIDDVQHENMSSEGYEIFSSRYDANGYSLDEYKAITEAADTLIYEANRRFKGDYYTPEVWVNKAHEVITNDLGASWKDEYVIWDPAAGTKNLTRDYKFKNLYSSTLYEGELMSTQHFNKDNVAFKYDFLNDDMVLHDGTYTLDDLKQMSDEELDEALKMDVSLVKKLLNKEPIVFLGNPPYGQAGSGQGKHKAGISNTKIANIMKDNNLSSSSRELYLQFYYRVHLLADFFEYGKSENDEFHIFFFSKCFLTSPTYNDFVRPFTERFSFKEGFTINSGEFNGTSSTWGVIFSHWSINGDKNQDEFLFEVLNNSSEEGVLKQFDWIAKRVKKENTLSSWMKEIGQKEKDVNKPGTKNGFDAPDTKTDRSRMGINALGTIMQSGNTVAKSNHYMGLFTMGVAQGNCYDVNRENFERTLVSFSIRRATQKSISKEEKLWVRSQDIFTTPSNSLLTDEFISDCVVYSLFDDHSNQTSLRNYEYNDKKYRVENEFFPFSMKFIKNLAVKHNNMVIQADLTDEHERFMYSWLEEHEDNLSIEAKALLTKAKELFEITFEYRDEYAQDTPRYQTNSWDAGYAQIYRLAFSDDRINDEFLDFKQEFYNLRTALGNKIDLASFNDGVI